MARNLALVFATFLVLFLANPAKAQFKDEAEQDTICVPVIQLQRMRQEVSELRRRDSLNTEVKRNLRAQVRELETVVRQDSIVIGTLERELDFRKQQIDLRDKRIENLESQLRKQEVRKWIYFAGGATAVVLGAWVSGKAAN